jgi:hypothetical protein
MKHLLRLNEYNDIFGGDWQEIESEEYWSGFVKPKENFTNSELNLIKDICDKNDSELVEAIIVVRIKILRHKAWQIDVAKSEDEWFYIVTNDDKYYKADQISGLMDLLNHMIKELNIKYEKLMNEILDYLDKIKDKYLEFGHEDRIALNMAYTKIKVKYGKETYSKFLNWINTR